MKQVDSLTHFLRSVNSTHIPYMITGAYAVSYYGMPRATHDVDVVIAITAEDVEKICKGLKKNYELDREMIENAVLFRTHFSIIHLKSDLKADLWVLKDNAVENAKFKRKQKVSLFGVSTYMISPEDIIITKLDWYKRSKNSKHMDDVIGIIKVQSNKLDLTYMRGLFGKLGIEKYWKQAVKSSKA